MNALLSAILNDATLTSKAATLRAAAKCALIDLKITSTEFAAQLEQAGYTRFELMWHFNAQRRALEGKIAPTPKTPKAPRAPKAPKPSPLVLTICSSIYASRESSAPLNETNDCSVRAFAVAKGIEYLTSHAMHKAAGRQHRKGTYDHQIRRIASELGMTEVVRPTFGYATCMTLGQFIKANPKGRFYVCRPRHAFAVIDGVVHDWSSGTTLRSKVRIAYAA